jgi:hypothetical protein
MTSAGRDILARLAAVGARVERQGDRLLLRAGPRPVPPPLIEKARTAKLELLSLLTQLEDRHRRSCSGIGTQPSHIDAQLPKNEHLWRSGNDSAAESHDISHRCSSPGKVSTYGEEVHLWDVAEAAPAAIIECDGGHLRSWVEGIVRLDPDQPRAGVPLARWRRFSTMRVPFWTADFVPSPLHSVGGPTTCSAPTATGRSHSYRFDLAPFMTLAAVVGYRSISLTAAESSEAWRKRLHIGAMGLCVCSAFLSAIICF